MTMIDDYCEPERILTYIDANTIYDTEYNELKWLGQLERKKIEEEYRKRKEDNSLPLDTNYRDFITKRLLEIRYYSSEYEQLPILKKEILLANALLPDDISIIELLSKTEYKFTIEHLKAITRFRAEIKRKITNNITTIDKDFSERLNTYKDVVTILISLFESEFGFNDSTIILNRICEMLVTCPRLFESKLKK